MTGFLCRNGQAPSGLPRKSGLSPGPGVPAQTDAATAVGTVGEASHRQGTLQTKCLLVNVLGLWRKSWLSPGEKLPAFSCLSLCVSLVTVLILQAFELLAGGRGSNCWPQISGGGRRREGS